MAILPTTEPLAQIERLATRAHSLVSVLIDYFCIPDRPSELSDAQLVDVLELVEESLDGILEHSGLPETARVP